MVGGWGYRYTIPYVDSQVPHALPTHSILGGENMYSKFKHTTLATLATLAIYKKLQVVGSFSPFC